MSTFNLKKSSEQNKQAKTAIAKQPCQSCKEQKQNFNVKVISAKKK